jgi:uncharacterized membrane protein YgcG
VPYTRQLYEHVETTFHAARVMNEVGCVKSWEASLLFDNLTAVHHRLGEIPILSKEQKRWRASLAPALRQIELYWVPRVGTQAGNGDERHARKEAKLTDDERAEMLPFRELLNVLLEIGLVLTADQEDTPALPVPAVTKAAAAAEDTGTHPTVLKAAEASHQDALGGNTFVLTPTEKRAADNAFLNPLDGIGGGGRGGGGGGGGGGGSGGGTSTGDGAPAQSGAPPTRFPPRPLPNIRGGKKPVPTRRERPGLGIVKLATAARTTARDSNTTTRNPNPNSTRHDATHDRTDTTRDTARYVMRQAAHDTL